MTLTLQGLTSVDANVESWMRETGDAEAQQWVEARLTTRDAYSVAAAAGMHMRLVDRNETIEEILAPDGPVLESVAWAWTLTDEQRETVRDLAIAECDRLGALIEELEAPTSRTGSVWIESLRHLAHSRDDLEGVRAILAEGKTNLVTVLDSVLNALDQDGRKFVASLPSGLLEDDLRLSRISCDPHAWWAELAGL